MTMKFQHWEPGVWHSTFTIGPDLRLSYGTLDLVIPGETEPESFFGWILTRRAKRSR